MNETHSKPPIYQLNVYLRDLSPRFWRRLQVRGDISLRTLHKILQISFDWGNRHLIAFRKDGSNFAEPEYNDWEAEYSIDNFTLQNLLPNEGDKAIYEYDFGDGWEHVILVEQISERDWKGDGYGRVIDGSRYRPPEDVGGTHGFKEFMEAWQDPDHLDHDHYRRWVSDDYDPDAFDKEQINRRLERMGPPPNGITLRCTGKALELIGQDPIVEPDRWDQDDTFADWYVNVEEYGRRKVLLIMHARTAFTVAIPGVTRQKMRSLHKTIQRTISEGMQSINAPQWEAELLLNHLKPLQVAKTRSRRVLGWMKDVAQVLPADIRRSGGIDQVDPVEIDAQLNDRLHSRAGDYFVPSEEMLQSMGYYLVDK